MPDFASKLESAIASSGMSQSDLSRKTGIPNSTISSYLTRANRPSWEAVQKITLALGIKCDSLQDDTIELPDTDGVVVRKPGRPRESEKPAPAPAKKKRKRK